MLEPVHTPVVHCVLDLVGFKGGRCERGIIAAFVQGCERENTKNGGMQMGTLESDGPSYTQPEAIPPRAGESLDLDMVAAYLRPRLPNADGALTIEQFIGGRANLTYVLHFGAQEYVLRRPPPPPVAPGAHDMAREYRVLSALHPVFPLAPRTYCFCEDESILGVPSFVMDRCQGLVSAKICRRSMSMI